MKKILSILIVVSMLMSFAVPITADGNLTATIASVTKENKDGTVTVTAKLNDALPVKAGGVSVSYDNEVLKPLSCEWLIGDDVASTSVLNIHDQSVFFFKGEPVAVGGALFSVTFEVLDEIEFNKEYKISMNFDFVDVDDQACGVTCTPGSVTVICTHPETDSVAWSPKNETEHVGSCTTCGEELIQKHSRSSYRTVKESTESEKGKIEYTCDPCGHTWEEDTELKDHQHTYDKYAYDNNGEKHWLVCSGKDGNCNEPDTSRDPEGHDWGVSNETVAATCTKKGERKTECSICGYIKIEVISINESKHSYPDTWTDNGNGAHIKKCEECLDNIISETHDDYLDRDSAVVKKEPTHTEKGITQYTCTKCSATVDKEVDTTGEHEYGKWEYYDPTNHKKVCNCSDVQYEAHSWKESVLDPTCDKDGAKIAECTGCGSKVSEPISSLGHSYGAWSKNNTSTHKRTCSTCGNVQYEAHKWNYGEEIKSATETEDGLVIFKCITCGEATTVIIPHVGHTHVFGSEWKSNEEKHWKACGCGETDKAEAHTWDDGEQIKDPTHSEEGSVKYTCTVCDAVKYESVDKVGDHSYGDWTKHDADQHKKTCACGDIQYEAHKWNSGEVTEAATHEKEGVKTYTCTVCSETKTEKLEKLPDHSYGDWTKHDADQHKQTCACGNIRYEAHKWNSGEVTKPATTEETGVRTYTCTVCTEVKTEEIPKADHDHSFGSDWSSDDSNHWKTCACGEKTEIASHIWDDGTVASVGNCIEAGEKVYTCTICSATKSESVLGDHIPGEWKITVDATCSVSGKKTISCTVCDSLIDEKEIPALGHTEGERVVVKEASCNEEGLAEIKCINCGEHLRTESVKKLSHVFSEWSTVKAPSVTEEGISSRICSLCGETETKSIPKIAEEIRNEEIDVTVTPEDDTVISSGTVLVGENITTKLTQEENSSIEAAIKQTNENHEIVSIYELELVFDGEKVKPEGKVSVELPIPKAPEGKVYIGYKVVYIDDNGVIYDVPSSVLGDKIVFVTDHFSRYAIIGIEMEDTSPDTGDRTIVFLPIIAIAATVSIICGIAVSDKRRRWA